MPRKSRTEASETRSRILASAQMLFVKRGFAATPTSLIAKQAGVTEGALFNHFPDKKRLFAEILSDLQREYDRNVRIAALGDGSGMAIDALRRGFAASLHFARNPAYSRIVMAEGRAVIGDAEWARIDSGMGHKSIEYGLRAVAAEREIAKANFKEISILVLGMLNEMIFAVQRKELADPKTSLKMIEDAMFLWLGSN